MTLKDYLAEAEAQCIYTLTQADRDAFTRMYYAEKALKLNKR